MTQTTVAPPDALKSNARRARRWTVRGLLPFGLLACSLVVDKSSSQCDSTADCLSKGSAFSATMCSAGACVSLLSEDCTELSTWDGKPRRADSILLGVLAPLSGDNAVDGQERVKLTKLAQIEFHTAAGGVPIGDNDLPRPVALLVCDQVKNAERAAHHLTDTVKVPGIIGPGFSGTTLTVARNVTIPSGTLMISPSATTPDLTSLADNGLVWRTASSYAPEATAFAKVVAKMEESPSLRTQWGLAGTDKLRVAVLSKWDAYGKGLSDRIQSELTINGFSATDQANANYYKAFGMKDPSTDDAGSEDLISQIRTFAPHVVLLVGTAEVLSRGLVRIEDTWPAERTWRPFYVVSEGAKLTDLVTQAGKDATLSRRALIFSPRYDDKLYGALRLAYQRQYAQDMPDIFGPPGSYDAFYLLALSMAWSRVEPTGTTLAEGLTHVSNTSTGEVITPGTERISRGVSLMHAGTGVNYEGVSGHLDFDARSGEALGDYSLYCVTAGGYVQAGVYYDTTLGALSGPLPTCP